MKLELLVHFVRQELLDRHAGTALGAAWTVLLPLAHILIFTLVFSEVMAARLELPGLAELGRHGYAIYLVSGLLAWNAFANTVTRAAASFREKAHLLTKVPLPLLLLPLPAALAEAVIYALSMAFFAIFLALVDFPWHAAALWVAPLFALQQLLALALGTLLAVFSAFLRDLANAVPVVLQLWFWLTPVVYVPAILPRDWAWLVGFNPMTALLANLRGALIAGHSPDWGPLAWVAGLAAALGVAAVFLTRRLERDIRDSL
ncbi:MAG: transport permease protein [Porticoccaceae bacterium]|nr:MAG: transport permease protein [Porticoccaceae bacterium]